MSRQNNQATRQGGKGKDDQAQGNPAAATATQEKPPEVAADDSHEESPLDSLESMKAALAAQKVVRELEAVTRCFKCGKKTGFPRTQLEGGLWLCSDHAFIAMMLGAELADELGEPSIREAFGLAVGALPDEVVFKYNKS